MLPNVSKKRVASGFDGSYLFNFVEIIHEVSAEENNVHILSDILVTLFLLGITAEVGIKMNTISLVFLKRVDFEKN